MEQRMKSFVRQINSMSIEGGSRFTIKELANYLRALADESELRLNNPKFPEIN